MTSPGGSTPDRFTGLPPGVAVGPLGRRFAASLVDWLLPTALAGSLLARPLRDGTGLGAVSAVGLVLVVAYVFVVWWMLATRAAGPGMRLMKLQLVGFRDGRPLGWGRVLARGLVLTLLTLTVLGLLLMLLFLLRHPRHQGWHDRSADGVVIRQRVLAPRPGRGASQAQPAVSPRSTAPDAVRPVPGPPRPVEPVGADGGRSSAGTPERLRPVVQPAAPEPANQADRPTPVVHAGGSAPVVQAREPAVNSHAGASRLTSADAALAGAAAAGHPDAPAVPADTPVPISRTSGPRPAPAWLAVLDDGRELAVTGLVLLGRNPQPRPGEETAQLIKLSDEGRTVSKSHLALGIDEHDLYVVDRGSTNGSTVTTSAGVVTRCTPFAKVYVADGSVVSMGDHWFTVRALPAQP